MQIVSVHHAVGIDLEGSCEASLETLHVLDLASDVTTQRLTGVIARVAAEHDIDREIGVTSSLVDSGITSMAMVDLMLAIELEFDIMIPQRDMTPHNFESIASLAKMLDRLN